MDPSRQEANPYVLGSPVNYADPSGLIAICSARFEDSTCHKAIRRTLVDNDDRDLTDWLIRTMNANAEDSVVQQMRVFNLTGNFTAVLAGVSSARSITHKLDLGCHARTFAFGAVTGTTKASAYWPWYKLVKDGGRWDFKDKILIELDDAIRLTDTFHSRWYEYSTPGNIHYAYVGRAAGFSGLELHAGATFAQQTDPENIPEENDWHGDQPTDYSAIEFGIHLWKTCQHPLTQACFKSILLQYSSKLEPADPPLVPYYNEEYGTNFPIDYFNGGEK